MTLVKACTERDIPASGRMAWTTPSGTEIVIFKVGTTYKAIDRRCTHSGGDMLDGRIENGVAVCPVHEATFDLDTGRFTDIGYMSPLLVRVMRDSRGYRVVVEGGDILVDV